MKRATGLVLIALVAAQWTAGCASQTAPPVSVVPTRTVTGAATPGQSGPVDQLTTSDAEIKLQVELDHDAVAAGKSITATVTISNQSTRSITYSANGCGVPALLELQVPIPHDSAGVVQTGQKALFKRYILAKGFEQGGAPVLAPVPGPFGPVCQSIPQDLVIGVGQTVSGSATWTADLAGVPAPPGAIGWSASFSYDPIPRPSLPTESPGVPIASWIEQYQHRLDLNGSFLVIDAGPEPRILAAAEAVDAALKVPAFAAWVSRVPERSWSNANLYLDPDGWHVELFAGQSTFAYVILDPVSGKVRSMRICSPATCKL